MGEETIADKAVEAPEESGQAEASPQDSSTAEMMHEAEKETEAAEAVAASASEGTGDEETQAVAGADDTTMAPSTDPFIEMMRADPRFAGASIETPQQFLDSTANLRERLSQREEDAVLGREARGKWDAFKTFEAQQEAEAKGQLSWNPPAMPVGMHSELQKPDAERDPTKVEAYNNRVRYINDRQTAWAEDPDQKLREHTLPAVVRVVHEMFAEQKRLTDITEYVSKREDYVNQHGREITAIRDQEGVPLKVAIELHEYRHKGKKTSAAEARKADAGTLATTKTGPTHVRSRTKEASTAATESSGMVGLLREAEAEVGPLDE